MVSMLMRCGPEQHQAIRALMDLVQDSAQQTGTVHTLSFKRASLGNTLHPHQRSRGSIGSTTSHHRGSKLLESNAWYQVNDKLPLPGAMDDQIEEPSGAGQPLRGPGGDVEAGGGEEGAKNGHSVGAGAASGDCWGSTEVQGGAARPCTGAAGGAGTGATEGDGAGVEGTAGAAGGGVAEGTTREAGGGLGGGPVPGTTPRSSAELKPRAQPMSSIVMLPPPVGKKHR